MNANTSQYIQTLSNPSVEKRYKSLTYIKNILTAGNLSPMHKPTTEVNNHIHTWYSFSPYSPSMAAYQAWDAGLAACGIVDHESVSGGEEMLKASEVFGLGATVGCELRVHFFNTTLKNKKLNNPDMVGIAYIVIHGIASRFFSQMDNFLKPIRIVRAKRISQQVESLSKLLEKASLPPLAFEDDVVPRSQYSTGGSITERHMLYACAEKLITHYGKGETLLQILCDKLHIVPTESITQYLLDDNNPHYAYDVLGILKSSLLHRIYIAPTIEECPAVQSVIDFAKSIQAIPAYPYLGDVGNSTTGDKKVEKFEDDFLDELFYCISDLGYLACTYMPPRNTLEQLNRVSALCKKHALMEISGVDINSSRQEFLYQNPLGYQHLTDSAWALIAHEKMVRDNHTYGLFNDESPWSYMPLQERITHHAHIGKNSKDNIIGNCTI